MDNYTQEILRLGRPLDKKGLKSIVSAMKDKKVVMIGEASHGTRDYYEWRQLISKELITDHGFNFVAVEGDWPPCQRVDRYVKGKTIGRVESVLAAFDRWPTWMWANHEFLWFVDWLKRWNQNNPNQVGVHGLDVYSFYDSADRVISILKKLNPKLSELAAKNYACLDQFRHNEKSYARSLFKKFEGCQQEILDVLASVLNENLTAMAQPDDVFDLRQNATIVKNAEDYYRTMIMGDRSWNVRDEHMMTTLKSLLNYYGADSKGIVWEHNTHIGDYRATDMVLAGQVNVGGLARETYGEENIGLVGFGSYSGSVTASPQWDGPVVTYDIPEAIPGSVEHACHQAVPRIGSENFYMIFDKSGNHSALANTRKHRAIGVVYDPDLEHRGNYVPTSLSNRYDAFIFLDHTQALRPLEQDFDRQKFPETWPYGNKM